MANLAAPSLVNSIKPLLRDPVRFVNTLSSIRLRKYQTDVVNTIVHSVIHHQGLSVVVIFPRQSGKNEVQAQIEAYLLTILSLTDAEIIKVSPTWKPQSLNAMRRLERCLAANMLTRSLWHKHQGYIYNSAQPESSFSLVHLKQTLSAQPLPPSLKWTKPKTLLPSKFDKDISPMAASTNATRVFWGTAWTSRTLLARELRAALAAQERDGLRRVFRLTAEDVAAEVPAYGDFVADQVQKLGRNNPMVRTQFFSEEIDAEGGMFPPARLALMRGNHCSLSLPQPGDSIPYSSMSLARMKEP